MTRTSLSFCALRNVFLHLQEKFGVDKRIFLYREVSRLGRLVCCVVSRNDGHKCSVPSMPHRSGTRAYKWPTRNATSISVASVTCRKVKRERGRGREKKRRRNINPRMDSATRRCEDPTRTVDSSTTERCDRDIRTTSGEGLTPGPGAGLEYDLWEGQFQFVGQASSNDRAAHRRTPRLSEQVQMIQEQVHALVDTQSVGEERYARVKQENATLQTRILMLEEAAKDAEARSEERLQTEQRRHREWACRLERERQLQLENYAIKLQAVEIESSSLRDEVGRLREQLEKVKCDKTRLENALEETRREAEAARENERQMITRANEAHSLLKAAREELSMKADDQQRLEELVEQVTQLRAHNKSLEESRDELQATVALQAGRELLLLNPCTNNTEKGPSLAVELLAGMAQDQADGQIAVDYDEPCNIFEIKQALKEQQEVNTQLRAYIDGILLNIVENYPQLLEVKQTH